MPFLKIKIQPQEQGKLIKLKCFADLGHIIAELNCFVHILAIDGQ